MGNFYTNITVQGTTERQLIGFLSSQGRVAYILPAEGKDIVVFDETSDQEIALDISEHLGCLVFFVENHDDDVLRYALYRSGKILDEYISNPDYHRDSIEPLTPADTCAQILGKEFSKLHCTTQIRQILEIKYRFEYQRHHDLVKTLGLPQCAVGIGFGDIDSGETPKEIVDRSQLKQTPILETQHETKSVLSFDQHEIERAKKYLQQPDCLQKITLRGMITLAVRSGRRAQSLAAAKSNPTQPKKDVVRIETALSSAESFCIGPKNSQTLRNKLAMSAFNLEKEAPMGSSKQTDWTAVPAENHIAFLVAIAALNAAGADFYRGHWNFNLAVEEATKASLLAINSGIPVYSDIERLQRFDAGSCTDLGLPTDPSENGPLGAL